MLRLSMQAENPEAVVTGKRTSQKGKIPTFAEFGETWLLNKRNTTKERTYLEYERLVQKDLNPRFGNFKLTELNRQMLLSVTASTCSKDIVPPNRSSALPIVTSR